MKMSSGNIPLWIRDTIVSRAGFPFFGIVVLLAGLLVSDVAAAADMEISPAAAEQCMIEHDRQCLLRWLSGLAIQWDEGSRPGPRISPDLLPILGHRAFQLEHPELGRNLFGRAIAQGYYAQTWQRMSALALSEDATETLELAQTQLESCMATSATFESAECQPWTGASRLWSRLSWMQRYESERGNQVGASVWQELKDRYLSYIAQPGEHIETDGTTFWAIPDEETTANAYQYATERVQTAATPGDIVDAMDFGLYALTSFTIDAEDPGRERLVRAIIEKIDYYLQAIPLRGNADERALSRDRVYIRILSALLVAQMADPYLPLSDDTAIGNDADEISCVRSPTEACLLSVLQRMVIRVAQTGDRRETPNFTYIDHLYAAEVLALFGRTDALRYLLIPVESGLVPIRTEWQVAYHAWLFHLLEMNEEARILLGRLHPWVLETDNPQWFAYAIAEHVRAFRAIANHERDWGGPVSDEDVRRAEMETAITLSPEAYDSEGWLTLARNEELPPEHRLIFTQRSAAQWAVEPRYSDQRGSRSWPSATISLALALHEFGTSDDAAIILDTEFDAVLQSLLSTTSPNTAEVGTQAPYSIRMHIYRLLLIADTLFRIDQSEDAISKLDRTREVIAQIFPIAQFDTDEITQDTWAILGVMNLSDGVDHAVQIDPSMNWQEVPGAPPSSIRWHLPTF